MKLRSFVALVRREWRSAWVRPSAYVERGVYAALLFVGCQIAWWTAATLHPWDYATYSQRIFGSFFKAQFLLATFLTTVMFARTMMREKERGTLDLLLLAPLTRFEVVFGKMIGQLLGIVALFLCGLPVLFFLLPLGGLSLAEVISPHLILVGHLMAVAGVCALFSSWFAGTIAVVLSSWIVVFGGLGAAELGRWVAPGARGVWNVIDSFNPFVVLGRELRSVESSVGEAAAVLAGGFGVMMLCCFAAGALLAGRHERHGSQSESILARVGRRLRAAAEGKGLGKIFRPLVSVEHPLMHRECSLERDGVFRAGWIVFAAAFALGISFLVTVPGIRSSRLLEAHVQAAFVTAGIGLTFAAVRSAVSVALDKRRGLFEAWLAANVEPGDIVRAKLYGQNLRTAYLIAPPALYAVGAVFLIEPEWEHVSLILPGLGGLAMASLTAHQLGFLASMFTRGGLLQILLIYMIVLPFAAVVAILVGSSLFSLTVFGALWGAALFSLYAYSVRRFRRWVLGAA